MCPKPFSETTVIFRKFIYKEIIHLIMNNFLMHIWDIRQNANWSVVIFFKRACSLKIGATSAILEMFENSPLFKHRLKFSVIKVANKSRNYLSGNIARERERERRERSFLNVNFFKFFLITSIFTISLNENILSLLKGLRIVTILWWFSNLEIIDPSFLVSEEEVGGRFSLIPRFFYNTNKKLVEYFSQFSFFFLNKFCAFN